VDLKTTPLVQHMDGVSFFACFAERVKTYPPYPNGYPIFFRMRAWAGTWASKAEVPEGKWPPPAIKHVT
jgi:hypothetical protein